jgi:hypothetical protein
MPNPDRVRVQYRDAYFAVQKIYIPRQDARVLDESGAAKWKHNSQSEMNLQHGLQITITPQGVVALDEVFFVGQARPLAIAPVLEKWHRLRLNCQSWTRFAGCRDPYKPRHVILSVA